MNYVDRTAELRECMEDVSLRLGVLHSVIDTLQSGLHAEHIEKQAVACMEMIGYNVQDIKNIIDSRLQQLEENDNHIESIKKHNCLLLHEIYMGLNKNKKLFGGRKYGR